MTLIVLSHYSLIRVILKDQVELIDIVFIIETADLLECGKAKCTVCEVGRDKVAELEHSPIIRRLVKSSALLIMVRCSVNHPMIRSFVVS